MKDCMGKPLEIGQTVVTLVQDAYQHRLESAVVTGFSKNGKRVEVTTQKMYRFGPQSYTRSRESYQVAIVEK